MLPLFPAYVSYSLAERFAMSEVAQSALCSRPLQKALQLYNKSDAATHGKLIKPPPPVGAGGGYMFSGRLSVPPSVRASVRDSRGSFRSKFKVTA